MIWRFVVFGIFVFQLCLLLGIWFLFDQDTKKIFELIASYDQELSDIRVLHEDEKNIIPPVSSSEDIQVVDVIDKVKTGVVSILSVKDIPNVNTFPRYYYDPFTHSFYVLSEETEETKRVQVGGGSGFFFSEEGFIMTNKHVVSDLNSEYIVVLHDGSEWNTRVIDRHPSEDVAVLQIIPKGNTLPKFTPLSLLDDEKVKVGQKVIAIGNALAEFQNTVTAGIVSGINRSIVDPQTGESIENLIQTDAAINPGNSGGPLINMNGEVVGMNTAIVSGAQGLSFALSGSVLSMVEKSIYRYGEIIRPFLGIEYVILRKDPFPDGLSIRSVLPNSPAEKGGLVAGDIITAINGVEMKKDMNFSKMIMQMTPGENIELNIIRNNKDLLIEINLGRY